MYWMIALVENDNWEEIVGRCHAYGGNWVFHWFMHSKQIYEPRETLGILLSPEITSLPTKPFPPYYSLGIPRAWTMGYKDNTWFFVRFLMAFVGNMNIHLAAYPFVWLGSFFLLHILWPDRVPSSGLTKILFFFLYYYYYSFLFPSFWNFGPSWSFLASCICCIFFGPTKILPLAWLRSFSIFFIIIIIIPFFFLLFGILGLYDPS